ncbi:hypothetical protein LINPERHAP2_LOCUS3479 [Linum perenne]
MFVMVMIDKVKEARKGKMRVDEAEKDAGNPNPKPKPKMSLRSRCALKKIREIVHMSGLHASKLMKLVSLGFSSTTEVQIGSLCLDFLKWAFECYEVKTKSFHFKKNDRLTITEGDVETVYGLSIGNKSVAKKLSEYKNSYLTELAIDNGLELENNPREMVCFCEKYESSSSDITPFCARWDNKMFKDTASMIQYEGDNTFPEGPVEPQFKMSKPFTGIVANLENGWGDLEAYEQENILEWLQMEKGVIDSEIVKESMELKMDEDKATQTERHE